MNFAECFIKKKKKLKFQVCYRNIAKFIGQSKGEKLEVK